MENTQKLRGDFNCPDRWIDSCFEQHHALIYTIALRLTRDTCEAEDVVQAVFCRLLTVQQSVDRSRLRPWLAVVARNIAIDRLRRSRREAAYLASYNGESVADSAEREAILDIDCSMLESALGELRSDLRDFVFDSFIERKPHRVIALERALPLGTVKTRIRTGLLHLRRVLKSRSVA